MNSDWVNITEKEAAKSGDVLAHVRFAFAEPIAGDSKRQMSLLFMLVVIGCNALKVVAIFLAVREKEKHRLVTIGDAIASFLDHPDKNTQGYCTISRDVYLKKFGHWKREMDPEQLAKFESRCEGYWERCKKRYGSAISLRRRMFATLMSAPPILR